MKTEDGSVAVEPAKSPYGKVIGIVKNREQLQAVSEALSKLRVNDVEVLEGAAGFKLLDSEQDGVSQCFLCDMDAEMVQRYRDVVNGRPTAFTAVVEPRRLTMPSRVPRDETRRRSFTLEIGCQEFLNSAALVRTSESWRKRADS